MNHQPTPLHRLRLQSGLSEYELARRAVLTRATIRKAQHDRDAFGRMRVDNIRRLVEALGFRLSIYAGEHRLL